MFKIFSLLLMKSSILVGGQAVIEGVMMRVPGAYATAVRLKDQSIKVQRHNFHSIIEKHNMKKFIIIRGMIHLYESMKMGYQTLDWSANMQEEEQKQLSTPTFFSKIQDTILSLFSVAFAITLFFYLPLFFTHYIEGIINQPFLFNIFSGIIRITIFLLYLILISQLKDVKRLFQYHGAEHKVVYNFESGEKLNLENATKFSTKHPRCGTSFVFILMLVTILTYSITDSCISIIFDYNFSIITRILIHLLFLPLIAGIGYEVLKFLSTKQHILFFRLLSKPGLWLQNITTSEPTPNQLEVSLTALKTAFGDQYIRSFEGKQFNADAMG